MSRIKLAALTAVVTVGIFASCEMLFTTSTLTPFVRDASTLSVEQQVSFAENAIASGNDAAIEQAYNALAGNTNPDNGPLVAELALETAGVTDAFTGAIDTLVANVEDPASTMADIEADLAAVATAMTAADLAAIQNAQDQIDAAMAAGVPVSTDQYLLVVSGIVMAEMNAGGGTLPGGTLSAAGQAAAVTYLQAAVDAMEEGSAAAQALADYGGQFSIPITL